MFFIFNSKIESTQVANGGSINHRPILADLIYLSRVAHERQHKLSARQKAEGQPRRMLDTGRAKTYSALRQGRLLKRD